MEHEIVEPEIMDNFRTKLALSNKILFFWKNLRPKF